MNTLISIYSLTALATLAAGAKPNEFGALIFSDTFDRNESQELKDEPGNEWTTSSDKTAKGNKQVDLREGHVYIYTHAEANHATSFRHAFEFKDGTLGLRFMFEDEADSLTLNFADMELKSVWAGHLFKVTISNSRVEITDQKTGQMDLTIRAARQSDSLSQKQRDLLAGKSTHFPQQLETHTWHQVYVTIQGDRLTCEINGHAVGSFDSEGFAHETKRLLRLLVPQNAYVDDVKIWRLH